MSDDKGQAASDAAEKHFSPEAEPPVQAPLEAPVTVPERHEPDSLTALCQEIVDFLHRLFPGHGAPGIPTAEQEAEAPTTL